MEWAKKNLSLVIGGAAAIVLLGGGILFLLSNRAEEAAVDERLRSELSTLKRLVSRKPHPNPENIAAAKQDLSGLEAFLKEARQQVVSDTYPTGMNNREFRQQLDSAINVLRISARNNGVKIPKDYWFTFENVKTAVDFPVLENLASQLSDIEDICQILFKANVNQLVGIKRAPVTFEDQGPGWLEELPTTNEFTIHLPYEFTFNAFSGELEKVMEGLVNADHCYIVEDMTVQEVPVDLWDSLELQQPSTPRRNPAADRYGGRGVPPSRYGGAGRRYGGYNAPSLTYEQQMRLYWPQQQPDKKTPDKYGMIDLFEEKQRQFVLMIQSVKLKRDVAAQ